MAALCVPWTFTIPCIYFCLLFARIRFSGKTPYWAFSRSLFMLSSCRAGVEKTNTGTIIQTLFMKFNRNLRTDAYFGIFQILTAG